MISAFRRCAILTLNVSVSSENITCDAISQINLAVTGGTGNYTVTWNDGETGLNRTDLNIGIYNATITDGNGCSATTGNIEITDDCTPCDEPMVANISETAATCDNGGSATIEMQGNSDPELKFGVGHGAPDDAVIGVGDLMSPSALTTMGAPCSLI